MLALLAAGSVFFPGLFLLSKQTLKHMMGWREGDAAIVSTRLVSSIQAVMASSAGCIIASSCRDVVEDSHWLTDTYILFATPYFAYDIYAMFLCYWHKLQVKGHEEEEEEGGVRSMGAAVAGYLRRELLMVLHHVFVVAFCFPASLLWRQGKGDFFQGVLFLAELSTPSVCLGKVLIQYKKQHTLLHKVNGGVMLLTFFSCRVLLFPYLYYAYSSPWQETENDISATCRPDGGARWKVRGSAELLQFILRGARTSVQKFILIHQIVVEIFQSGPKR